MAVQRKLLSIGLSDAAFVAAVVVLAISVILQFIGNRSAVSPKALRAIEQAEAVDNHYTPDAALLSSRGRSMRKRGRQLFALGVVLAIVSMIAS